MQSQIFVIIGPSGVGKGTLINRLLEEHPEFVIPNSYTTRPPRQNEGTKKKYIFVTGPEFMLAIEQKKILEYVSEHGYLYGTDKESIDQAIAYGKTIIAEIEPRGAETYKKLFPGIVTTIFIAPESIEKLKDRILFDTKRGQINQVDLDFRLVEAIDEMKYQDEADFVIINRQGEVDLAYSELKKIIAQKNPQT